MSWSTITATLNTSGLPNVSYTISTSDYPDILTQAQNMVAVQHGFWTNTSVGAVATQFVPATSILYLTVS
jgi:hypothetical protein